MAFFSAVDLSNVMSILALASFRSWSRSRLCGLGLGNLKSLQCLGLGLDYNTNIYKYIYTSLPIHKA